MAIKTHYHKQIIRTNVLTTRNETFSVRLSVCTFAHISVCVAYSNVNFIPLDMKEIDMCLYEDGLIST